MAENVLDYILRGVHGCEGFEPEGECQHTEAQPGTRMKINTLAARVLAGEPLWHDDDRNCLEKRK